MVDCPESALLPVSAVRTSERVRSSSFRSVVRAFLPRVFFVYAASPPDLCMRASGECFELEGLISFRVDFFEEIGKPERK